MSGRRQKQLRRAASNTLSKTEKLDHQIRIRKLMESPVINASDVIEYLQSRFVGKTGYHYISVSAYGSLFIHENYKALVPIILHKEFPITSTMGRFSDPNQKDCAISLVRVDPTFKGIIVDRSGTLYSAGIKTPIPKMAHVAYLCSLGRVGAVEYQSAIRSQEEAYSNKLDELMKSMQERAKRLDEIEQNPYDNPYDIFDITPNPYETETPL